MHSAHYLMVSLNRAFAMEASVNTLHTMYSQKPAKYFPVKPAKYFPEKTAMYTYCGILDKQEFCRG